MDEATFVFKPTVPVLWFAALAAAVAAATDRPSPQMGVFGILLLVAFVASTRAKVVLRDGVVYRRRLFGWESEPLLLEEVAKLTLRRELSNRYFQRELTPVRANGSEMSFECWAWANWQELAE